MIEAILPTNGGLSFRGFGFADPKDHHLHQQKITIQEALKVIGGYAQSMYTVQLRTFNIHTYRRIRSSPPYV
jgi:hypothetical protein